VNKRGEGWEWPMDGTRRRSGDAAASWGWTVNEIPSTPGCPAAVRSDLSGQDWLGGSRRDSFLLARSTPSATSGGPRTRGSAVPADGARRRPHKKRPAAARTTDPTAESTCGPITR